MIYFFFEYRHYDAQRKDTFKRIKEIEEITETKYQKQKTG